MREGYKDSALGEIPRDWEVVKLGELCEKITDGSHFSPTPDENGESLIATVKDMMEHEFNLNSCVRINKTDFDALDRNGCQPKKGDVLFSKDGTIGKTFVFNGKQRIVLLSSVAIIRILENNVSPDFVCQVLKSHVFESQLKGLKSGSAIKRLVLKAIKEIKIPKASILEQQKIAKILSAVDEKLEIIDQQIAETSELKEGLMQKLLTKGIGHTKFKDSPLGEIPESWEVVKLKNVVSVKVGRDLQEDNYSLKKDINYPYPIFSNTVSNYGLYGFYNFPEYQGESVTVIGRGVGVGTAFYRDGAYGAIGRLLVLFPNETIHHIFLSYYINFSLRFFSESSAIPQLTGTQIIKYNIKVPPIKEQKQIANILSTVDDKLEVLKDKKSEFQELKKGLMQQLLTGKVRVRVEERVAQ